jgi:hypothetical protein
MGIVKISDQLHEIAKQRACALNRSINAQAEHWMRIGKIIEENQDMTYRDVWQLFLREAETTNTER